MNEDVHILTILKEQKLKGIRYLYSHYGDGMEMIASYLLGDKAQAREVVSDVIWDMWINHKFDRVDPPLRKFLYTEISKACKVLNQTV